MTKEAFHEEELRILRKNARNSKAFNWGLAISIITILLVSNYSTGEKLNNHEGRIAITEQITKNILNNSGVEFIARSAARETEDRMMKVIDRKVDKSAFEILCADIKYIKEKIDD